MNNIACLNAEKLSSIAAKLQGAELKVLLFILGYLSNSNKKVFVNCKETRNLLASFGFEKSPERISMILSGLVNKGILRRETSGVFSVIDDLYLPVEIV